MEPSNLPPSSCVLGLFSQKLNNTENDITTIFQLEPFFIVRGFGVDLFPLICLTGEVVQMGVQQ